MQSTLLAEHDAFEMVMVMAMEKERLPNRRSQLKRASGVFQFLRACLLTIF